MFGWLKGNTTALTAQAVPVAAPARSGLAALAWGALGVASALLSEPEDKAKGESSYAVGQFDPLSFDALAFDPLSFDALTSDPQVLDLYNEYTGA